MGAKHSDVEATGSDVSQHSGATVIDNVVYTA